MGEGQRTQIVFAEPRCLHKNRLDELNALLDSRFAFHSDWTRDFPHMRFFLLYRDDGGTKTRKRKKLASCVGISLRPGDPMSLWNVATALGEEGKGYSSCLLRHVQVWAHARRPFQQVWLLIEDDAPQWLHTFYGKLGFRRSQRAKVRGLWEEEGVKMVYCQPRRSSRLSRPCH